MVEVDGAVGSKLLSRAETRAVWKLPTRETMAMTTPIARRGLEPKSSSATLLRPCTPCDRGRKAGMASAILPSRRPREL